MSQFLINALAFIGLMAVTKTFLYPLWSAATYATGYLIFELRLLRAGHIEMTRSKWSAIPAFWWRQFLSDLSGRGCDAVESGPYRWERPFKFKGFGKFN